MRLTLTFDNGPDREVTPRVLDILAAHGMRAHFFVLGKQLAAEGGRSLVERVLREGHHVGNHSFSHRVPLGDDARPDAVERELGATEALLAPLLSGVPSFRPFGGGGVLGQHLLSRAAASWLLGRGYTCALWNSVPRDWEDVAGWPARALADLELRAHSVVVLHDVGDACLPGLDGFLGEVRRRGHETTLELPEDCTPIVAGRIVGDLHGITRGGAHGLAGAA